ncbi:MAG TPA: sulfurtransferase-like selenium metabolism protein YedF [Desulfurivibrio alkaliphilus]|uniref:Sulfurtransferase-like selenium metabolism protein YedF n=1 Tax=Desulfurivibrio alkaliphilus TaxID=427923 RepID=A0A7C2TJ50_9BACT|nr:sulfurtransferase-like selenium metabolism protein YedF [Desulfurivibrio alkaliphilus]
MSHELDCRGLACPGPVTQIKDLLAAERPARLVVTVDNQAARENVSRFLHYHHYQVEVEEQGDLFRITGTAGAAEGEAACELMPEAELRPDSGPRKIMVLVASDRLGHGDDDLGAELLLSFLKTLKEMGPDLWRLVLVNAGVTLTVKGAAALPALQELAAEGVHIMVCGTCLSHFQLLEKKEVGETTNMLDIVTAMQLADSVINV